MTVRAPGEPGYVPPEGFPPDVSGAPPFQNDVELPWWEGGGKGFGFGPGGFPGSAKLTPPASGPPQGLSLPTNAAGMGPHVDPTTGQPEMLTGPGGLVEKTRGAMNPWGFIGGGNPYWRGALAAGGVLTSASTANDAAPTNIWNQRPSGVGGMPGPQVTNPTTPYRPEDSPSFTAPNPYGAGMPRGMDAGPIGPPAPAVGLAAGPAATRQRPNLGTYGAPAAAVANSPFTTLDYRPNSGPNERNRGSPQATALDLSRLFGGGQPAPAAAAPVAAPASILARPDLAQRVPLAQTPLPPRRPANEPPRKKSKSSSTSQDGGYRQ